MVRSRRHATVALLAVALAVTSVGLGACGSGDEDGDDLGASASGADAPPGDHRAPAVVVDLKAAKFEPSSAAVKVGETVRWVWGGGVQHDVVGDGFESTLQSKGRFDHTFTEPGTFTYRCEVHPSTMRGTITVS